LIWIDTLISPASVSYGFSGLATDGYGHLYVSGGGADLKLIYRNDTAFNSLAISPASYLAFIMKTDTSGAVRWMQTFSGTNGQGLRNLITMPGNKIAIAGSILGKVKCDIDSITSYSGEATNPYFTVMDTAGYVHELQQLHAPGLYDWINITATDRVGSLYLGGQVTSNIWGGSLSPYNSVGGNTDFFITKYGVDCNCTAMPVSNFTYTLSGTTTVSFTYTGSPGDSVRWYFGDGSPVVTYSTPAHVFSTSGTFTVRCWVYTSCGRDLKAVKVVIPCTYPGGASFTQSGVYSVAFNYTGSLTSVDSVRWKFGDGGGSPLVNPTHNYAAVGTYNVCVKVYSWCMVDSFCTTITVPCITAPTAGLATSGTGATRNFTYTGTTTGVTSMSWDYGDGSGFGSGATTPHTYGAIGVYTVCVTATSPCGSNVICATVNVTCLVAPTASYTKSGSMAVRSFGYTGTLAGVDSVAWNFGDGGHATGATPSHAYSSIGVFTVCAIAYSPCGNDTSCDTMFVPCLSAPYSVFAVYGTDADSVRNFMYPGSMGGIDSTMWLFSAGTGLSSTTSAMHIYSDTGSYTVCLVLYSRCGNDTSCSKVYYHPITGLGSVSAGNIHIYPNPVSDQLMVAHAAGCEMKICDVVGREVLCSFIGSALQVIDMSGLESGVYVVQFSGEVGVKVVRVVKR
jgi:PKD repeat protein